MPSSSARVSFLLSLVFFFYLVCVFSMSAFAAETSDLCPPYLPPVIRVSPHLETPELDHSKPLADIGKLAGRKDGTVASGHHEVPVGLTVADLRLGSDYEVSINEIARADGTSYFCAEPAHLELSLAIVNITVFIAKELPVDTCSYRTISQHEGFHVREDRDIVLEMASALPAYLSHEMRNLGVVQGNTQSEVKTIVTDTIQRLMTDIKAQIIDIRQKRQAAIDSPQEYDRLSQSCDGSLRSIIARTERKAQMRKP